MPRTRPQPISQFPGAPSSRGTDRREGRAQLFLVPRHSWTVGITIALVAAIAPVALYHEVSLWIGPCLFATALTMWHMVAASSQLPPIPHLSIVFAGVQLVFMAWLGHYYPPHTAEYDISGFTTEYLAFGAPAFLAFGVGMLLPLAVSASPLPRLPNTEHRVRHDDPYRPALKFILDVMVFGGIVMTFVPNLVPIAGLRFLFVLLAYFKYVGAFGFLIMRIPGWQWRIALLIGMEIMVASRIGMFGGLVIWAATACCLILTFAKVPRWFVAACVVGMLFALPALEQAKARVRAHEWHEKAPQEEVFGVNWEWNALSRPFLWVMILTEEFVDAVTFNHGEHELKHLVARHNHGWIVTRVMQWVPEYEPYARGETIGAALYSAFVPRILDASKARSGGEQYFERFTGKSLTRGGSRRRYVSMNLGFSGELYANFGKTGGIVACGFYGLFIGLIYRFFMKRGHDNPLWWAFCPLVIHWAVKSETGLTDVTNWISKSAIIIAAAVYFTPILRHYLGFGAGNTFQPRTRHRRSKELTAPPTEGNPTPGFPTRNSKTPSP